MVKRVVCFGGGSAMPKLVLSQLKSVKGLALTTVTSMVDNGGSAGALRRELNILPPGDIRRHILALSEAEEWKKKLWDLRFARNIDFSHGHSGHNFANVFIGGLEHVLGSFEKALEIAHEFMRVKGRCLPATTENVQLYAELENGQIICGEDEIDVPRKHDGNLKIARVWLEPNAKAYRPVVDAIKKADYILIGPGDLYSSIVCCFLPQGITDSLREGRARKIFIAPAMTKFGETNALSLEEIVEEVERYIGCKLDYVVYNTAVPNKESIRRAKTRNPMLISLVTLHDTPDERFVGEDLLSDEGTVKYDAVKFRRVILKLLEEG